MDPLRRVPCPGVGVAAESTAFDPDVDDVGRGPPDDGSSVAMARVQPVAAGSLDEAGGRSVGEQAPSPVLESVLRAIALDRELDARDFAAALGLVILGTMHADRGSHLREGLASTVHLDLGDREPSTAKSPAQGTWSTDCRDVAPRERRLATTISARAIGHAPGGSCTSGYDIGAMAFVTVLVIVTGGFVALLVLVPVFEVLIPLAALLGCVSLARRTTGWWRSTSARRSAFVRSQPNAETSDTAGIDVGRGPRA